MDEVAEYREKNQPIKERTGGSTFKNPPGHSAWKLVDAAGMRGFRVGGAKVSEMHCNFLINDQGATGEDVETFGETVRARVKAASGIELQWEIIRLGRPWTGGQSARRSPRESRHRVAPSIARRSSTSHVAVADGRLVGGARGLAVVGQGLRRCARGRGLQGYPRRRRPQSRGDALRR